MVLHIIEKFREMLERIAPEAVFECDFVSMLNIKADTLPRYETDESGQILKDDKGRPISKKFIYIEEPSRTYYGMPSGNLQVQRVPLNIFFCMFEPMQNTGYNGGSQFSEASPTVPRLELKEKIEEEMVRPFLACLRYSPLGVSFPNMLENVSLIYPEPRFDANEVSVGLELTIYEHWCVDNYREFCK